MSEKLPPAKRAEAEVYAALGDFNKAESLEGGGNARKPPEMQLMASSKSEGAVQRQVQEPALPNIGSQSHLIDYQPSDGRLMERGQGDSTYIHHNDVEQGSLNDCYILSALAAVARSNPALLANRVNFIGNNTYEVTLYRRTWNGNYQAVTHQVTASFPDLGFNIGAAPGDNGEIWVQLFEKAFAIHYGNSYQSINSAGNPAKPLSELLGREVQTYDLFGNFPVADIASHTQAMLQANVPIVFGTPGFYRMPGRLEEAKALGIVPGHAYTAISSDGTNVRLYNPQGSGSENPMELLLSFQNIKRYFSRMVVGGG